MSWKQYVSESAKRRAAEELRSRDPACTSETDSLPTVAEIEAYHRELGCNFGDVTPFDVVKHGILKAACGWHNGSTCNAILEHHGLVILDDRGVKELTRKGKMFLWEHYKTSNR